MMVRRIPILSTLLVLIAAGVMIRLGFWQLDRMHQKEALLARFAAARALSSGVPWPRMAVAHEAALFRKSSVSCDRAIAESAKAGRNGRGESGWTHTVRCAVIGGGEADVAIGWTLEPPDKQGSPVGSHGFRWREAGPIHGIVGPSAGSGVILVANPPLPGLAPNALPDPRNIPNNHFAYAVQWFLFAVTALVIYALALRKKLRG